MTRQRPGKDRGNITISLLLRLAYDSLTRRKDFLVPTQLSNLVILHHLIRAPRMHVLVLVPHDQPNILPGEINENVISARMIRHESSDIVDRAGVRDVA